MRGICEDCGKDRSLQKYANPERYLCARCRQQERDDMEAYLERVTGVVAEPDDDADLLHVRRLVAIALKYALEIRDEELAAVIAWLETQDCSPELINGLQQRLHRTAVGSI